MGSSLFAKGSVTQIEFSQTSNLGCLSKMRHAFLVLEIPVPNLSIRCSRKKAFPSIGFLSFETWPSRYS